MTPAEMIHSAAMSIPSRVRTVCGRLLGPAGVLPVALRRLLLERAAEKTAQPGDPTLTRYGDKVATDAAAIGEADLEELRRAGYSDEEIYDATVCAAVGASLLRFERGLELLALPVVATKDVA
jgi:hypothetical protein